MATSLYQGPKENEQGVNCTYLYQEKRLRSVFKEYLPVPVPRETFDIRYPQEKPLRSVFKEYLPVPVPRETFDIRYPYQEKPLRSVFKEYLLVPVYREKPLILDTRFKL